MVHHLPDGFHSPESLDARCRIAARSSPSVRHSVHYIVDAEPKRKRRELLRIARIVGPLPGVTQVHVEANGDHHAPSIIANPAPSRDVAVFFIRSACADVLLPRHLKTLAKIVEY